MANTTPTREEHIASFMEVLGLTREEAEVQHELMLREADLEARYAAIKTPILDRLNALPHRGFHWGCTCDTCQFGRGCATEYNFVESLSEDEADAYRSELLGLRKAEEEWWASCPAHLLASNLNHNEIPF